MPKVLVPLAGGCEELEAVTIIDLLRRAGVEVVVAGLQPGVVKASRGVQLLPDTSFDAVMNNDFDMIVLPGGMPGAKNLREDARVIACVQRLHAAGKTIAAICAAPTVLLEAGVLAGKRATSYPGFLDVMQPAGVTVVEAAVVEDGNVVTSRGPGTAMDFALVLIERLCGVETRQKVEAGLIRG
jgi:4-methyl-5(b-hydroxyethyl)-thiazole monophosphate biosynthesis